MFTLPCVSDAWWAGGNHWMLSVQMLNHCWHAVVVCQFCFAVNTLHFVIFFFKCEMIPNFGHSLSFTGSFLAHRHRTNSVLNVVVCVHNNSPCGKMIPELSRSHNVGDRNEMNPRGRDFASTVFCNWIIRVTQVIVSALIQILTVLESMYCTSGDILPVVSQRNSLSTFKCFLL